MYKITLELVELEKNYETFEDAFYDFYSLINLRIIKGFSRQILETACWIKNENDKLPITFHQIKIDAYNQGLLTEDGKLVIKK